MVEAPERRTRRVDSVCLYCGSSNDADPAFLDAARDFGRNLAENGARLVYGGGGVGLMGAAARAAHGAGGRVLGIIPEFLTDRESLYGAVETVVVPDMPTRKLRMFEESDAFAVLPGGIGTLEEIVELLSWKRLDLHRKPVVFLNIQGFWDPLFELFRHTIDARLTPAAFTGAYAAVERVEDMLPALEAQTEEA
jgi:uncharacterized protein (TIGR00730 family)